MQTSQCPYNKYHTVIPEKFLAHLRQCRKKLSKKELAKFQVCRFNKIHIFHKSSIVGHQRECPDRPIQQSIDQRLEILHNQRVKENQFVQYSQVSTEDAQQNEKPKIESIDICPKKIKNEHKKTPDQKQQASQDKDKYENQLLLCECQQCLQIFAISQKQEKLSQKLESNKKLKKYLKTYRKLCGI